MDITNVGFKKSARKLRCNLSDYFNIYNFVSSNEQTFS